MKIIVTVGAALIIWILGYYLHFIPAPKPAIYQYITLTLIFLVQPVTIYWTIKRNYDSSNHLAEKLDITVTADEISIQGESFYTKLIWHKIFKVDEVTGYFMIYQNNLSAIIISKKNLTNAETSELRKILKAVPGVPNHLKEEA